MTSKIAPNGNIPSMPDQGRIKVGHLVSAFVAGGIERNIRFMADPMGKLGVDFVLISLNDDIVLGPELESAHVPAYGLSNHWKPIRFPILPPPSLTRTLQRIQANHGIEIIHAHHYAAIAAAPMVARTMGVPYVVTNHATDERWQSESGLRMGLLRRYMRSAFEGAKSVLCWTQAVVDDVTKVCGHPLSQCEIVELPINDRFFSLSEPSAIRDIDIVMVGRLAPQKNVLFALDVFRELSNIRPTLKVALLGGGPQEEEVRSKARALSLEQNVEVAGDVDPERVIRTLNRSKVQYMPSLFEGLSAAFIEALALGLDAVVSDIPSFRAPFAGEPGVSFAANTDLHENVRALDSAVGNYRFRDRSQFKERFNTARYCERVISIYEKALSAGV